MEKWFVSAKKADFDGWARELGVDPLIARLIRNRDVTSLEEARLFLNGTLQDCHSPWLLKDAEPAVREILAAIAEGKKIRVIGDYDVDGICSSHLLTKGLALLGAKVDVAIPHRILDGYGLNDHLIKAAAEDGVGLIVTCDNGIAAAEQILLAGGLGVDVVVTDHHEVPFTMEEGRKKELLPKALAVVDPKREEDSYPFSGICGCVVAYKLLQAMGEVLEREHWEMGGQRLGNPIEFHRAMEEFVQFAAFATVCDVMELKDENRILVREGLRGIRRAPGLGLKALLEVNGIEPGNVTAYHLGFVLGPCLNATGRLDTAHRALELLGAADQVTAMTVARDLKELNDSRKNLTLRGIELAMESIRENGMEGDKILVVYLPEIHESLAGIIAGRLREFYGRPAILLTRGEDGVKGSGRSVEAYHMHEALTEVGFLLTKFGGHKMAAGLSLPEENVDRLRRELNDRCHLTEEDFVPVLHVDADMPMDYASLSLARQMELLEPFGVGNPKPLFVQRDLCFLSGSRMGKEGKYGRFRAVTPSGRRVSLTYFGSMDAFREFLDGKYGSGAFERLLAGQGEFPVHVVYQTDVNSYRGKEELQFLMKSFR